MSAPPNTRPPTGMTPPNVIRGSGVVQRQQILKERQIAAEQARVDAAQREQQRQQAAQEAAKARQKTVSTRRSNPNVFFDEKTGQYDFIVKPTYNDPLGERSVSKSEVNPDYFNTDEGKALGKQFDELQYQAETAQDFNIYKNLQSQGIDPGQLTIARNAAGDITSGFGSKNGVKLNVGKDNSLRVSYSQPATPVSNTVVNKTIEDSIINSAAGKAKFLGSKTQFGYSISKDRYGNITSYQSSLYLPKSQQVSEQAVKTSYGVFKENQIIEAVSKGVSSAYSLTSGDTSSLKSAGFDNLIEYSRPMGGYDFGIATPVKGKPQSFEQTDMFGNILRSTVTRGPSSKKEYYVPNPTNPFDIRGRQSEATPINKPKDIEIPKGGPLEGAKAVFENIFETGRAPTVGRFQTGEFNPQYKPEVESSSYSALANLAVRTAEGRPNYLNLLFFTKEMGDIGRQFEGNIGYGIGSVAASAAMWAVPFGKVTKIPEALKGVTTTLEASGIIKNIPKSAEFSAQAFKFSAKGEEIPLALSKAGVFTEPVRKGVTVPEILRVNPINIPKTSKAVKLPDFIGITLKKPAIPQNIAITRQGVEDLTVNLGKKTTELKQVFGPLTETEKQELVGQEILRTKGPFLEQESFLGVRNAPRSGAIAEELTSVFQKQRAIPVRVTAEELAKVNATPDLLGTKPAVFQVPTGKLPNMPIFSAAARRGKAFEKFVLPEVFQEYTIPARAAGQQTPKGAEIANFATFRGKQAQSFLKDIYGSSKTATAKEKALADLANIRKSKSSPLKRGFDFEGPSPKIPRQSPTSNRPLELISASVFDNELRKLGGRGGGNAGNVIEKQLRQASSGGRAAASGGGNIAGLIGLGRISTGKGAGRKSDIFSDTSRETIRLTGQNNMAKQIIKNIQQPQARSGNRSLERLFSSEITRLASGRTGRVKTDLFSTSSLKLGQLTTGRQSTGLNSILGVVASQSQTPFQIPRAATKTSLKISNPQLTHELIRLNPPRFNLKDVIGTFDHKESRKKRKGRKTTATFRTFRASDVLAGFLGPNSSFAKEFNKQFGKLY